MSSESEIKTKKVLIDEQMRKEISYFLTKKRRAVINVLAEKGELSQGDIALAIASTPASLSNIILIFDQYKYKLLEGKSVGKYRYYTLSDLGKAYIEDMGGEKGRKNKDILNEQDIIFFQEAKECIEEFKKIHNDEWETKFDTALMRRIYGMGELLDDKSELLVNQYLKDIEILTVRNSDEILNKVFALLTNSILRDRIVSFMNYFDPFVVVLKSLEKKENILSIGMILRDVFNEESEVDVKKYIDKLGWKNDEYCKLKTIVPILKKCMYGYGIEEIYQYFNGLLPNQELLSMCISQWV